MTSNHQWYEGNQWMELFGRCYFQKYSMYINALNPLELLIFLAKFQGSLCLACYDLCFAKVFGWVSTGTTATSTQTRSRVSGIHLRWHYTKCTGDPWRSPRMGHWRTKSHHVLYFPRLGNKRTSRSLQAGYMLVLDFFPQHHFLWNTNLPLFPTVVSMNEWLLFSLASLVALFCFLHVLSRTFV